MPSRLREEFRRSRVVRIAVGLSVLVLAFAVEYRLANVPLPVDIDATGKFSPATVRLNQEELVIVGPVVHSPEGVLLSHDGKANEIVDVHFDNARLDEQTVEDLSNPKFNPPSTPGKIDYTTPEPEQTPEAGEPCRTFLSVELKDRRPPRALHFYQLQSAGAGRHRHLEIKTDGAELAVSMVTDTPPGVTAETPGCRKRLRVGSLPALFLPPSTQLTAVAAADSAFRVYFRPLATDAPLWEGGPDGFFEPLVLGLPKVNANEPPTFQAREVSIRRLQDDPNSAPVLSTRSADGGPLLDVYGLKIGSGELQVKVSGRGEMSVNGQVMTVDFLERAQKHPLIAVILAGLNGALLTWFIRLLSSKGEPTAAQ